MIYTMTFSPSMDYLVRLMKLEPGNLHRTESEELYAGGKGINVSTVLKELGKESTAFGFIAGFIGDEIRCRLNKMGIGSDFIRLSQGDSRINIKLISGNNVETEINAQGPAINKDDIEKMYLRLNSLKDGDFLVLSGSVPKSIPEYQYVYAKICEQIKDKNINIIVDAEEELLLNTLPYQPFLIKPNHHELGRIFGQKLQCEEAIIDCAKRLQKKGAKNVLISMEGNGALLIDKKCRIIRQNAPKGEVLNSVGAGDALIAGFITGLQDGREISDNYSYCDMDYEIALKYSVAAGSASAFSKGYPKRKMIEKIYSKMK